MIILFDNALSSMRKKRSPDCQYSVFVFGVVWQKSHGLGLSYITLFGVLVVAAFLAVLEYIAAFLIDCTGMTGRCRLVRRWPVGLLTSPLSSSMARRDTASRNPCIIMKWLALWFIREIFIAALIAAFLRYFRRILIHLFNKHPDQEGSAYTLEPYHRHHLFLRPPILWH